MSAASKPPSKTEKKAKDDEKSDRLNEPGKRPTDDDLDDEKESEEDDDDGDRDSDAPESGKATKTDDEKKDASADEPWVPRFKTTLWNRAIQRWIGVTAVLAFALILYTQHPYYRNNGQFQPWRTLFPPAFFLWLGLGAFYLKITLEKWSSMRDLMRDAPLHILILTRAFQKKRFWRRAKNRRLKTTLLAICVKGFFTPLMIGFVTGHLNSISKQWLAHKHLPQMDYKVVPGSGFFTILDLWWHNVGVRLPQLIPSLSDLAAFVQPWAWSRQDFSWGLGFFYDIIFAVDCGWALVGYGMESRWLGNKTKSVEPTAFGWLVALACYPPFNNVLGTYLPLETGPGFIVNPDYLLALRAITVFLFAIYAAATVAFGAKFSNLTNRGIISRGPYRFVRHPAYLCKCTAWWMEHLPTMTLTKGFFLSLLCGVYALRAWTEERHLSVDPDYVAYRKKVPWVIFPGVY